MDWARDHMSDELCHKPCQMHRGERQVRGDLHGWRVDRTEDPGRAWCA